jgi:segregation and condensation protein A
MAFSSLFAHTTTRSEVVVTFLALLELIRLKQLVAAQEDEFGEILISPMLQPASTDGVPADPFGEPPTPGSAAPDQSAEAAASSNRFRP